MVEQKRSGPSGSPCCGPSSDTVTCYPNNKNDGCGYNEMQKAHNSGKRSLTDNSMSDLCTVTVEALAKSSFKHNVVKDQTLKVAASRENGCIAGPSMLSPSCRGPNTGVMRAAP